MQRYARGLVFGRRWRHEKISAHCADGFGGSSRAILVKEFTSTGRGGRLDQNLTERDGKRWIAVVMMDNSEDSKRSGFRPVEGLPVQSDSVSLRSKERTAL